MKNDELLFPAQLPHDISEERIREALADFAQVEWASLALKTLNQRAPEQGLIQSRNILKDNKAPERLRSVASVELGKRSDAKSEELLIDTLKAASPGLLKHVVRSLGQIGGKKALAKLEKVKVPEDSPAGVALRFAKTLISYRIGSNAYLLEPGREITRLKSATTERVNVEFSEIGKEKIEAALPSVRRQLPAINVDVKSGLRFMCGASEHWVLLNADVAQKGSADALRKRPFIAGAILKYRVCSAHYSLDEYILTNGGKDEITLIGVRGSGVMVHAGVVSIRERAVRFELRSSNPPYSRPIDLSGTFDTADGRLAFNQVLVGTSWKIGAKPLVPRQVSVAQD
jgi:hypothetical protein